MRNPARTSLAVSGGLPVRTLAAQAYFSPPLVASARAHDATNNDTALGYGDTLTLVFDRETDGHAGLHAIGVTGPTLPNRTYVDALLAFRDAAGLPVALPADARYTGEWVDTSTLVVTFGGGLGNASAFPTPTQVDHR